MRTNVSCEISFTYRSKNTVHVWAVVITELSFNISNYCHPQLLPRTVNISLRSGKISCLYNGKVKHEYGLFHLMHMRQNYYYKQK